MNNNLLTGVAAIALCAALILSAQTVNSAESLLQAATKKELVDGNLAGAIDGYQRALAAAKDNRAVAAQALLQLGQCYRKQGNAEARRTFERLLRDYGDQTEAAAKASEELAALTSAESKPKFTKIRVPTKLRHGSAYALSPDGKELAYVSEGSVWLLPVHGASDPEIAGQPRRITEAQSSWSQTTDIAWSGDGKLLALHVWKRSSEGPGSSSIYLVPSAGGEPREVSLELPHQWDNKGDWVVDLSPDGRWLAYPAREGGEDSLEKAVYIASISGGQARKLTLPTSNQATFSPHGRRIAYVKLLPGPKRDPARPLGKQVWVTDVAGGSPRLVYDELPPNGRLRDPIWSPDGKMLAFLATPEKNFDDCGLLFIVSVGSDGRPVGSPAKIELPHETIRKIAGWSKDNKIGLMFPSPNVTALYTVPAAGGKAVQLTPKAAWMPSWTRDGKGIFFDGAHHGGLANIEYIPAAGGAVTRIPVKGRYSLQPSYPSGGISVSPDGKKILFQGHFISAPVKWIAHIFTIPIEGGEVSELATGMEYVFYPCWSPDGKQIAFMSREFGLDAKPFNIFVMPAEGGKPQRLTSASDEVTEAQIAWSPDGEYLAYQTLDNKIQLLPVEGGPSQVLVEGLEGHRPHSGLAWTPDGKELAYATKNRIWKVNLATGNSEELQTGLDATHMQMAWSPDGKAIAFSAVQGGEPELWLMEDFLPYVQAKR
jgi:Tol biopolymer transport system component